MTANETQTQFDLLPTAASAEAERFLVRKRDGHSEPFNDARIQLALESAFKAELGVDKDQPLPPEGRGRTFPTWPRPWRKRPFPSLLTARNWRSN